MPSSVVRRAFGQVPVPQYPFVRPEKTFERTFVSTATALYNMETFSGTAVASTVWPSANLAVYIPFIISEPFLAYQLWWFNGATVGTDNADCAIYDEDFVQKVSTGATLSSGATAIQAVDISDTFLQPGRYYFGLSLNGTTATIRGYVPTVGLMRALGVAQQASAHTLPNPMVPATPTSAFVPICGAQGTLAF